MSKTSRKNYSGQGGGENLGRAQKDFVLIKQVFFAHVDGGTFVARLKLPSKILTPYGDTAKILNS
jgi:hypothetical protein